MTNIDDLLFSPFYVSKKTELEKAKEISAQLSNSIEWLTYEANRKKDHQSKNSILMEAEAARREKAQIDKVINKENNNG